MVEFNVMVLVWIKVGKIVVMYVVYCWLRFDCVFVVVWGWLGGFMGEVLGVVVLVVEWWLVVVLEFLLFVIWLVVVVYYF